MIAAGGGSAHLFGASTGGALALEAAAAGVAAISVAAYDVPYSVTADAIRFWQTYVAALHTALAEDDRDRALELFMGVAGSPDEEIAQAKASPIWATLRPLAHTLAYDAACLNDGSPPDERLARIRQPVLLITRRPGTAPDVEFFGAAADAAAQAIPSVARQSVSAASHVVDAQVLAPVLADFYRAVVA